MSEIQDFLNDLAWQSAVANINIGIFLILFSALIFGIKGKGITKWVSMFVLCFGGSKVIQGSVDALMNLGLMSFSTNDFIYTYSFLIMAIPVLCLNFLRGSILFRKV